MSCFIEKYVDCHQNGIGVESQTAILVRLLFELDHCVQPVLRTKAAEYPSQFAMGWHLGLYKQAHLLGVNASGQKDFNHLERVSANIVVKGDFGVVIGESSGEGMIIRDHQIFLVVLFNLLVLKHIADGSKIVPDVQVASGLDPSQQDVAAAHGKKVAINQRSHYSLISY